VWITSCQLLDTVLDTECPTIYTQTMRKIKIIEGEYYHIFNRGNNKQNIFSDNRDWIRFLFLVLYFQSPVSFENISRPVSYFVKHRVFNINNQITEKLIANRYAELACFAFLPNHFHLIIRENKENGISQYMQRILNAYTKYFNTKYEKAGHLFQGPFKAVHVESNEQLLHLSAYIHRNPRETKEWKNNEHFYPFSSYQDYFQKNRWGKLLENRIIMDQFSSGEDYKKFTDKSGTKKETDNENLLPVFIDSD